MAQHFSLPLEYEPTATSVVSTPETARMPWFRSRVARMAMATLATYAFMDVSDIAGQNLGNAITHPIETIQHPSDTLFHHDVGDLNPAKVYIDLKHLTGA
jgi:hypothetical protein